MKEKRGRRGSFDPDAVIAGRSRPQAPELIALIHDVNPTGRGLPPKVTALRYAQKSRLQSVLVTRFQDEIEIRADPSEPGVVSLVHGPSGLDACHAVIDELDVDARSWVQRCVDIDSSAMRAASAASAEPPAPRRGSNVRAGAGGELKAPRSAEDGDLSVSELLAAGREAAQEYAFDVARARFEAALDRASGAAEPAVALLSLLVDHLAADEEALALEGRASADALSEPEVRVLFALAAARRSQRERALRFLNDARGGAAQGSARKAPLRAARVVEVYAALARGAIEAGRLDEAAEDISAIRKRDPIHPALVGLSAGLAKGRAAAREPAEVELCRLFGVGDIAGAERAAHELLARWPDSDAGKRIARAIDDHRRREQADKLLASARDAIGHGETTSALALLRRSLASGLGAEDAAWAERRINALEEEARAREDRARIDEVLRLILAGDLARALPAYAALDGQGRQAVRGASGSRLLLWLDELAPPGAGAKVKAAIPAVLALGRAVEIAAREPSAALDMLEANAKVLHGFEPAEEASREARRALAELRRSAARRAVEAARRALSEGKPDRANESLRDVPLLDLPDDERAAADDLWAGVRRLLERRILTASLEQSRRERDDLRALGLLEQLLAIADALDMPHLEALRSELRADVQRRFFVHVEHFNDGAPPGSSDAVSGAAELDPLWEANVCAEAVLRTLLPAPASASLEGAVLVLAHTRGRVVFLRLLDVATGKLRARATLCAPAAINMVAMQLLGRHLLLVGWRGALLEIAVDSFHIVRWCPNVFQNSDAFIRPVHMDLSYELNLSESLVDDAVITPDGRSLWMDVITIENRAPRCVSHVLDLEQLRLIREIRDLHPERSEHLHSRPVIGLKTPRVAMVRGIDDANRLLDTRGLPVSDGLIKGSVVPDSVTACPDGERVFMILVEPRGPIDPRTATYGWVESARGVTSPIRLFDGIVGAHYVVAATSLSARMTFALFEIGHERCELFGLRDGGAGLEIAYRMTLPRRSTLLGDAEGRHVAVMIAREDRVEIVALGADPPALSSSSAAGSACIEIPILPTNWISTAYLDCDWPSGARLAAVTALCNELLKESSQRLQRRLDTARRRASADDLLALEAALSMLRKPKDLHLIAASARQRFPNNPRVRLSHGRSLVDAGRWSEARDLLSSTNAAGLDEPNVKHLHHLLGVVLIMVDQPEAALIELKRVEACKEGRCEVRPLVAALTPLEDASATWTPQQATLRDLMARIASADAALARGDPTSARRSLDCPVVWEAYEVQSFARLAEAYLLEEEAGAALDPFRMTLALLSFCELSDRMGTLRHCEMPLVRAAWSAERLGALTSKARARALPAAD